jgi:hypothetical protein
MALSLGQEPDMKQLKLISATAIRILDDVVPIYGIIQFFVYFN